MCGFGRFGLGGDALASGSAEERDEAFFSINAKRFDFAIFDRAGLLVAVLEYQGAGHYHQDSFMRDAVKREVLRKAGVPFLEIEAQVSAADLAARLRACLTPGDSRPINPAPQRERGTRQSPPRPA